jgi:polysaccharide deacetylase 2 family uncharacterized protein YibQ
MRMGHVNSGTSGENDIERPLGMPAGGRARRLPMPKAGTLLTAAVVVAVIAAAGAIAWRDQPFRAPSAVAVSTPQTSEVGGDTPNQQSASERRDRPNDGPSIVRVGPPRVEDSSSVVVIRDPTALTQDLRVAHLPDRALIEGSAFGPLPMRAADGRRPFDVYARPWSGARGARVAIVIGGLGLSQTGTQHAIERLPGEVTLGFAPHGNSLDRWMQAARRAGHEILMQIPLEPFDYPSVNPGRNTLTVAAAPDENRDDLLRSLGRITNYVGVMNYMGGRFTVEDAAMRPLMEELGRRGLMYLDDGSSARSVADSLAGPNGVPFAAAETTIDSSRQRAAILERLDELERTARAQGFAVGTGSAFDVTVETVASWIVEARRRGIEIVPISALAHDPGR